MATAKEESLLSQTRLFVTEKGGGRSQWWWWWMGWVQRLRRGAGCRGCLGTSRLTPRLLLLSAASCGQSFMRFRLRCWMSSVSIFHLWQASSSCGHLQPPGPSGAPPSPHSLLVTVTPSKLPLQLTIWIGWWHSYNTLLADVEQSTGHMRYTYIILGHLARRQLRYCEGHVCLKMALSGLKSEQEP